MKRTLKRIARWVVLLGLTYVSYIFIVGMVYFALAQPRLDGTTSFDTQAFYRETQGVDRVMIVEERMFSAITRLQMIEAAEHSIQIAYYAVHQGLSSDLFYAALIEAAERDVKVELLLDGVFHNFYGDERATFEALVQHDNIEIRFYEPVHWLKPWTFNNRLHDKFILVDGLYAMIGGRNIGDQYFLETYDGGIVKDRDVLIINTAEPSSEQSVLASFEAHFDTLFNHDYTVQREFRLSRARQRLVDERKGELLRQLAVIRDEFPFYFGEPIDWLGMSDPTNQITLVINPIERRPHEPTMLGLIAQLMQEAEDRVVIQSPYIIPSRSMRRVIDFEVSATVKALTNSFHSSPNYFAMAGYWKHRDRLMDELDHLYEYQGPGSIHGKSYVFDDRLSIVGSFNMDARSSFLSTESIVIIDSETFVRTLDERFLALIEDSYPVNQRHELWAVHLEQTQQPHWQKLWMIRVLGVLFYPLDALL